MADNKVKFQLLLRELFQFDCADLDFGIYRIMNHKRGVIEKFITEELPKTIAEELERGTLATQSQAAKELKEVAREVTETLGGNALDADGNLAETFHGLPLGKKYLIMKSKAGGGSGREALEANIFNHLNTFFSRYYQDGDFISKRRYSKRQRYAIPYNGEEVYLYWANNDQYYIKTAEHFHDYTFTSSGVTAHFKLQAASVEQNNVKGDKRFFIPRIKEIDWDEKASQLAIPFEYRPLTAQEEISYGKKNQQDAIIAKTIEDLPKGLSSKSDKTALVALTAEKRKDSNNQPVTLLEHHLRQYTRRNTSDFFIHKDLQGFLSRELDFYLKNEVLNLDEMETAGEDRADGWFQMMRVIKSVGGRIIEFLHQIEEFQKMLWEKRKFITETQYCITVGNIAEDFYPDIAACEPQWTEWKELFHIDETETNLFNSGKDKKGKRIAFLKHHPTLVLDTKHFDIDFVDKLLGGMDDLDEITGGLLVHSENWQALNLLLEKYRDKVKCIYIDPPYNTGSDGFPYKDTYKHASWLGMIHGRVTLMQYLMSPDALFFLSTDENEAAATPMLLSNVFGEENRLETLIWKKSYGGGAKAKHVVNLHEYVWGYTRGLKNVPVLELRPDDDVIKRYYKYQDSKFQERGPYRLQPLATTSMDDRPNLRYPIPYKDGEIWPDKQWQWSKQRTFAALKNDELVFTESNAGIVSVNYKQYLRNESGKIRGAKVYSIIDGIYTQHGTGELKDVLGGLGNYKFPKPSALIKMLCELNMSGSDVILDAFAGSGPTGQGVIALNQEDGSSRKFILMEMAGYFETDLLPRIKKVTFTPEWKDGKPKRMATQEEAKWSPRIVKYMRLESYEDALNNIQFDDASGQGALKFDDYLLKYMLKWETRASETLLNVEKLARPFHYKLHIHADGQTREEIADVPETFNYLLGLHVQTRQVHDNGGRRYLVYRGRIDNRKVVVIWRETEGWQKADLERDKKFVAERKLTEGADEVFVNGDSFIPNAKALEPVLKARMFAPVET